MEKNLIPKNHWSADIVAGISVALVALPLGLGASIASGVPPLAGILSAIIAGLFTTFYRGTDIAVNGTSNGLIVITASAAVVLSDPGGGLFNSWPHILGAFLITGVFMTLIGLFKLAKIGNMLPNSVIYGLLAAIGVLIIMTQVDDALGVQKWGKDAREVFGNLPFKLLELHPIIFIIAVASFLFSMFFHKIPGKFIKLIPAPMWILIGSILVVLFFGFHKYDEPQYTTFLGLNFALTKSFLIDLKGTIQDNIVFPSFAKIGTFKFWTIVLSSTFILTVENLASAKSIEKLDPYKRKANLNKDMIGMGISTIVASCIGALPIITVILRSSVAINQGGKTRWTNFFHGIFMLALVVIFADIIQLTPLAALAGILIYTGFKLTSPKVFKDTLQKGREQLLYLLTTFFITLYTNDLLIGLVCGIIVCLFVQYLYTGLPFKKFLTFLKAPVIDVVHREDNFHAIKVNGVLNFINSSAIFSELNKIKPKERIGIDLSHARLVDSTVMENIQDFAYKYRRTGGVLELMGMDNHRFSSPQPCAMRYLPPKREIILSPRQRELSNLAQKNNWTFRPEVDWQSSYLQNFDFFITRPIEYKNNFITGNFENFEDKIKWEIADITFDEGAGIATEVYHTTVQLVYLPKTIPEFTLEKEGFFDRFKDLTHLEKIDIDMPGHEKFSKNYLIHGPNRKEITNFFGDSLIDFFEKRDIYHIESNGEALLIFKFGREAHTKQVEKMLGFTNDLLKELKCPLSNSNYK